MQSNSATIIRFASWVLALVVLFSLVSTYETFAQQDGKKQDGKNGEAAEAKEDPTDELPPDESSTDESDESNSLGMMVVSSGAFSWVFYVVLFGFSIVGIMVALERLVNLRREKIIPAAFCGSIRDLVNRNEGNAENFRSLADSSETCIARVLRAGVLRAGRPLPEVEKSMEDAIARETANMRSRNRPLTIVGNIAPLLGLLGTVVGMIFAFSTASQVGLGRAEELAKGIYLALLTTAGGLSIAIPAMLCAAWFGGRVERFMREIDEVLLETVPSFAAMENPVSMTRMAVAGEKDSSDRREPETAETR